MFPIAQLDAATAAYVAVASAICLVIGALAKPLLNYVQKKGDFAVKNDQIAITELKKIIVGQEKRIAKLETKDEQRQQDMDDMKDREQKCLRKFDRIKSALLSYEEALRVASIPFRPVDVSDLNSEELKD